MTDLDRPTLERRGRSASRFRRISTAAGFTMSNEQSRSARQQEPLAHEPGHDDDVIELPAPKADRGAMGVDDHVAHEPLGLGHQPDDDLDRGVDAEHLSSPSQGVRPGR